MSVFGQPMTLYSNHTNFLLRCFNIKAKLMHGISEDTNALLGCIFLDERGKDIVSSDPDL